MGSKQLLLGFDLVVIVLLLTAIPGFSQVQAVQNRIPQQVLINGQKVNAVNVVAAGGSFQAFTCLNPQQYSTLDGTSQGWACYEQTTGVWLLNALPPAQAQQPQPPQTPQPPQPPAPAPVPQTQPPQPPVQIPQPQAQPPAVVYPQQPPTVVYPQPPVVVVYAPPPPAVIYQQAPPTIVYTAPVYSTYPVVVAPAYPPSVVLGTAAINAAGRIISSAIGYRYPGGYYYGRADRYPGRVWRR
jgi:hypothetical protein